MEDNIPAPPAWVHKRDGRQEPFDADKISRALFAASESLNRPDAFLARELTDGVVHFLTEEIDDAAPTTNQIAELVVKVVRELGQPALAATFEDYGARRDRGKPSPADRFGRRRSGLASRPARPWKKCCRTASAATRYKPFSPAILAAAQGDGLLTLTGLETPYELAGCVLGPPVASMAEDGLLAAVEKARISRAASSYSMPRNISLHTPLSRKKMTRTTSRLN